jgi:hypothetical protein
MEPWQILILLVLSPSSDVKFPIVSNVPYGLVLIPLSQGLRLLSAMYETPKTKVKKKKEKKIAYPNN